MVDVTAEYFAVFREQAGCNSEALTTASSTARELFAELAERHGFLDTTARCKVAINGEMADWEARISAGDVVLFFPPVAGG
jgi:molybdopterin converting factor subunit 1